MCVCEGWQRSQGNCPVKNWLPNVCVCSRAQEGGLTSASICPRLAVNS